MNNINLFIVLSIVAAASLFGVTATQAFAISHENGEMTTHNSTMPMDNMSMHNSTGTTDNSTMAAS